MSVDERVQSLEEEYKLIRGEVHRTLGNVRDFLLSLKVPNPPEKPDLPELHKENHEPETNVTEPSGMEMSPVPDMGEMLPDKPESPLFPEPPPPSSANLPPASSFPEPASSSLPDFPQTSSFPEQGTPESDLPQQFPSDCMPTLSDELSSWNSENQAPESPKPQMHSKTPESDERFPDKKREAKPMPENHPVSGENPDRIATLDVNLLANLMRWTTVVINEIGIEQLDELLDLYAATGNLPSQLREFILHISETQVTQTQASREMDSHQKMIEQLSTFLDIHNVSGSMNDELAKKILHFVELLLIQFDTRQAYGSPETWSRLMLELHGILTRETVASQLIQPYIESIINPEDPEAEEKEEREEEKIEASPQKELKLKLVLTGNNGTVEEFSLDLPNITNKQDCPGDQVNVR